MPLWSLTLERSLNLENKLKNKQQEKDILLLKTIEMLWISDLDELYFAIEKSFQKEENDSEKEINSSKNYTKKRKRESIKNKSSKKKK